jgi:hypothetical protein
VLTAADVDMFREQGFCIVKGAFSRQTAAACVARLREKARFDSEVDFDDPESYRHFGGYVPIGFAGGDPFDQLTSPAFLAAMDALVGAGRYVPPVKHGYFWASLPGIHKGPWEAPKVSGRWHIDNGRYPIQKQSLRSGNCAIVPIWVLTDSLPGGGSTCAIPGSHRAIASVLHRIGEVTPSQMDAFSEAYAMNHRGEIVEMTGETGDVVLLHPYLVHAASANTRTQPRLICNTGVCLNGPRRLDPAAGELSVVEQIIVESARVGTEGERRVLGHLYELQNGLRDLRRTVGSISLFNLVDPKLPPLRRALFEGSNWLAGTCGRTIEWMSTRPSRSA